MRSSTALPGGCWILRIANCMRPWAHGRELRWPRTVAKPLEGKMSQTKVPSVEAWEQFCDRLKEAGRILARPEVPTSDIDGAEGLRYLARMTRVALQLCFEHSDPDFPTFLNAWHATANARAGNTDTLYL